MGLRKGQKPNHRGGKKGRSGRKSGFQERLDAERLVDLVTKKYTKEELRDIANKESVPMDMIERMVLAAHVGNSRVAIAIFNKLFPDTIDLKSEKEILLVLD